MATALAVLVMAAATHWRAALIPIDPWDYVEGALNFPNGVWNEVGLSRWAMLAPLMLFGRLWGNAEATYYAYPILAAGLLAGVLYGLAARLVNRWTGLAGALLVCSSALVFVHLSRGYPDVIAVAFVGLSLLALMIARDVRTGYGRPARSQSVELREPSTELIGSRVGSGAEHRGSAPVSLDEAPVGHDRADPERTGLDWRVIAWVVLAGGSAAWAVEVRELTVLAWPALALAVWRVGRPGVVLPAFLVLPVIALCVDLLLSWRVYGDPLLKLGALTGNSIASSEIEADSVYVGHSRWWYVTIPLRILWERSGGPALVVATLIGLVGGAALARRLAPLWAWGASVFGLLWLAGGALRPGAPSLRLDIVRYNLAYAIPLALTAVCVLAILVLRSTGGRRLLVAVAAGLLAAASVVPSARFVATFEGFAPSGGNALRELDAFLGEAGDLSGTRIWSDWGSQRLIEVYSTGAFGDEHWEPEGYRSLNRLLREPVVPEQKLPTSGDLVVLYSTDDQTCYHCNEAMAKVEAELGPLPLAGWEEVFRSSTGNLVAYRLPEGYVWPRRAAAEVGTSAQS